MRRALPRLPLQTRHPARCQDPKKVSSPLLPCPLKRFAPQPVRWFPLDRNSCALADRIRHPPFVICHPPFVICHFSFPIPRSAFRIFSRAERATQSLAQRKLGWPFRLWLAPFHSLSRHRCSHRQFVLFISLATGHRPLATVLPPLATGAAARRDQRGQVVRRPCPAGYCLTPTGRVAGRYCYLPAPSELDVRVAPHPAQAFTDAPCGTRSLLSVFLARGSADDSWRVVTPCYPPFQDRLGYAKSDDGSDSRPLLSAAV